MKLGLLVVTSLAAAAAPSFADRAPVPASEMPPPHMVRPPPPPPLPSQPAPLPPEIGALARRTVGSYACKGVRFASDGSSSPLVGKLTIKTVLGGAWIEASFVAPSGVGFEDFRTFDPIAQQWSRVQLASSTASTRSTSLGEKAGAWTWEGTATSPQGSMQTRDHEQLAGRRLTLWGEALLGGGWQKLYEMTCTR